MATPTIRVFSDVDCSKDNVYVEVGFVPDWVEIVDESNDAVVKGRPGSDVFEHYDDSGASKVASVSDGIMKHNGIGIEDEAYAGIHIDTSKFNALAGSSVEMIAFRADK